MLWGPTPYRKNKFDEVADMSGVGRYRVKKSDRTKGQFEVYHNNVLVSLEPSIEKAKFRAELGAKLLSERAK